MLFLAAQFGIWIGMVGHSAEFYFSVSGFVSFSQCHFSCFVYALEKPFSLKLWVVNLIILNYLSFFVPPTGWTLSTCFVNSPLSSPVSLAIAEITHLLSSSFVSSFPGFRRPLQSCTIFGNIDQLRPVVEIISY